MNHEGIMKVCEALDLRHSRDYGHGARRGAHVSISCPLAPKTHTDERDDNMSCSVRLNSEGPSVAKCHSISCGFEGSLMRLVEEAISIRPPDKRLIRLLTWLDKNEKTDVAAVCTRAKERVKTKKERLGDVFSRSKLYERDILAESITDSFSSDPHDYATRRGIEASSFERWGLRFDPRLSRLVFPVRRTDGKLVGLTGRAISDDKHPKWFNYSGLNKARYLFGAWLASPGSPVILTEGPIDAVIVDQSVEGYSAVACLGSGLSIEHANTIKGLRPPSVILFPDGDRAGVVMATKAADLLKPLLTKIVATPEGKDPGSMSREEIKEGVAKASVVLGKVRWKPS